MHIIENRGSEKPNTHDVKVNSGLRQLLVNVNVREEPTEGIEGAETQYVWDSIVFAPGEHEYDVIVYALIRYKYPQSKMESIVNNYLADPDNEKYASVFKEMQTYRAESKSLANAIISDLEK